MKLIPITITAALSVLPTMAAAQESAHVHGIATLNLAIEGDELEIEFVSPADNIVGFEHEAESAAERKAIKDAIASLENAASLFDLPAAANCELHEAHARHTHDEHDGHDDHGHEAKHDDHDDHGHEAKHDDHDDHEHDKAEGEHSEFHAHYHFECNGTPIEMVGLRLFAVWPRIEEIHLQALTPTGQFGGDIEADDPVIRLK